MPFLCINLRSPKARLHGASRDAPAETCAPVHRIRQGRLRGCGLVGFKLRLCRGSYCPVIVLPIIIRTMVSTTINFVMLVNIIHVCILVFIVCVCVCASALKAVAAGFSGFKVDDLRRCLGL